MYSRVNAKSISLIGVLVAMEIILSKFLMIHTSFIKIGFNFLPIAVAAMCYGPVAAGLVAVIGDIVTGVLFPVGAFFPGFTLSAFITGLIFGLFLKKKQTIVPVVIAVLLSQVIVSQFINTLWLSILYESPYWPLFVTRIPQTAVMCVVEIVTLYFVGQKLIPIIKNIMD